MQHNPVARALTVAVAALAIITHRDPAPRLRARPPAPSSSTPMATAFATPAKQGVAGVAVSNQDAVITTDASGRFQSAARRRGDRLRLRPRRLSPVRQVLARSRRYLGAARLRARTRRPARASSPSSTPPTPTSPPRAPTAPAASAPSSTRSHPPFSSSPAISCATPCASARPRRRATTSSSCTRRRRSARRSGPCPAIMRTSVSSATRRT